MTSNTLGPAETEKAIRSSCVAAIEKIQQAYGIAALETLVEIANNRLIEDQFAAIAASSY